MVNTNLPRKSLDFIVGQHHLPTTFNKVNSFVFGKIDAVNPTDKVVCRVDDSAITLLQK
jgi:hypothetical protein